MCIYKQLADQFIHEIQSGQLKEGSRIPSLRQLSKQHAVSMSTAVSCYQELESLGWIHARPQAGYYVNVRQISHSIPEWTQFISQVSNPSDVNYSQTPLHGPLGMSHSDIDQNTLTELERSFRRATKRMGHRMDRYPDIQGELSLRRALSSHFSEVGIHFKSEELIITSGCMSAIRSALESCSKEGDAIAISSPCFNGILELLGKMSRKIIEIPSLSDGIDLHQLETHFKKQSVRAGIFCTSHMNPQGITMSGEQKKRLAELANAYQIPVIEDDVYLELSYTNHYPLPAKYYDAQGYIFWCGSISKSLSPGYRLGWCLPGRFFNHYQDQFASGCNGVSTLLQSAMADFIESGQYNKYLKRKRFELLSYRCDYLTYLSDHLSPKVNISNPQGGLVLWLQIPNLNDEKLIKEIEKEQLDIRQGSLFTTLNLYKNCLRINIGHPLKGDAKKDLNRLIVLINLHSG